jgi:RecB family exonuclease
MELGDPEEPHVLSPRHAREERDYLHSLHFDYVRLARRSSFSYLPKSTIAEEGNHLAWTSVSPSQIENFNKCKRLWWFKSILRLPELQKGNQALGEATHLIAEVMESVPEGTLPRVGYEYNHADVKLDADGWKIAETLGGLIVPMVPRSRKGITVLRETKITLDTYPGGPTMIGYIDLGIPPGLGWPALMIPESAAIVGDYKTLSDFRYMKTPAELADSVQMMTYAKWAIEDGPGTLVPFGAENLWPYPAETRREVYLAHLYARTKPPFGKNSIRHTVACVTSDQINAKWSKTLDTIREMDQTARYQDAQDVEATGVINDHCGAYGGCAYRDKCGLNAPNPIANLFSIKPKSQASPTESPDMSTAGGSSILAKIQAARAQAAGQSAPTPAATPSAPAQTPATPAPQASAPVQSTPSATATLSKGPVSTLVATIQAANAGGKPSLTGLVALLYAKEQGITFTPGTTIPGEGSLAATVSKTMADLVALSTKTPAPAQTPITVATGIVPGDAPPREQPVITQPGTGVDPIKANAANAGETVESVGEDEEESDSAPPAMSDVMAVGTPAENGKKRGRPSKAESEAKLAAEKAALEAEIERRVSERLASAGPVGPVDTSADEWRMKAMQKDQTIANLVAERDRANMEKAALVSKVNAMTSGEAPAVEPTKPGFVIYVDCYPVKGKSEGIVDYLEWYAPIASAVAQSNSVDDWRLINFTGKGVLATFMRAAVKEGLPAAMTISTNAPGADVAMEVLSPLARTIVRRM